MNLNHSPEGPTDKKIKAKIEKALKLLDSLEGNITKEAADDLSAAVGLLAGIVETPSI